MTFLKELEIKKQLIEEYTDMIEAIGIVEFITAHEKAIAEAKGEKFNEEAVRFAIFKNNAYPLILNLPESEKPLFMKIKYHCDIKTKDSSTDKEVEIFFDSVTIEEIGGK